MVQNILCVGYNLVCVISNDFWWFEIPTHSTIVCKIVYVLCTMLVFTFLWCGNVQFGFPVLL